MKTIMNMTGLAIAASIGLAALTGAQAAPFSGQAPASAASIASDVTEVGQKGARRGHRHRRHRHGFRGHYVGPRWGHGYHRRCYWKKVRVYDPFIDGFFYETRKVCRPYY